MKRKDKIIGLSLLISFLWFIGSVMSFTEGEVGFGIWSLIVGFLWLGNVWLCVFYYK